MPSSAKGLQNHFFDYIPIMIFPTSFAAGLAILVLALVCWGSWANTLKRARKWRYELYYFDFSVGFVIFAAVAAFTLGSLNTGELTFQENFLITGYRKMAFGVGAGVVFNLAVLLLCGAVSVAGMTLAFPVSLGVALIIGVIWNFAANPEGNVILLFGGAVLVLAAVTVIGFAYTAYKDALFEASRKAALQADPRVKHGKRVSRRAGAAAGIALSVVSGIFLGFFPQVAALATEGDNGVAPYGVTLLIALGLILSAFIASPFTINFPLTGAPARIADYFRGRASQHLLGILGGATLCGGLLAGLVVDGSPAAGQLGPLWRYALGHGAPVIAMLWGLLVWHEFQHASDRVRNLLVATLILFGAGVAMISVAPLYAAK